MRHLKILVIYSFKKKIQNIAYTETSKFLLYDYCGCLIYFNSLKLNKYDEKYNNFYQIYIS